MKRVALFFYCFVIIVLMFCGCASEPQNFAETNQEYISEVAGKCFQAKGGQLLTFYKDGVATYDFQNGVGENHHYNYRVMMTESSENVLNMLLIKLEDVSDNYVTRDYIDNGAEELAFNRNEKTMKLYALTYNCIYDDNLGNSENGVKNEYGTPTTICEQDGCERYIAPSGNTRFCTEHSKPCKRCGKFMNPLDPNYCEDCPIPGDVPSDNSNGSKKCSVCNGTGYVKYYYGDSDLQAYLDGYDPYTVGKCTSCNK